MTDRFDSGLLSLDWASFYDIHLCIITSPMATHVPDSNICLVTYNVKCSIALWFGSIGTQSIEKLTWKIYQNFHKHNFTHIIDAI